MEVTLECDCYSTVPFLMGVQKEHSAFLQLIQCAMICQEEEQWAIPHSLPEVQEAMWQSTFFMVLQWGRVHCGQEKAIRGAPRDQKRVERLLITKK